MDIVNVLKSGDVELVRAALAEVHKLKAFSLADSEFLKEEWGNAARLHAHHIALMSRVLSDVEVDPESITGRDYVLAKAFREAETKCATLSVDVEDEFYRVVVEELNRLVRLLCS